MNLLNKDQINVFARAILPELHRLQKRYDSRTKRLGGVCHLNDPEDLKQLLATLPFISVYESNELQRTRAA